MAEVLKLGITLNSNQPIQEKSSIEVHANKGIEGDRHFKDFNDPYNQISLIESELYKFTNSLICSSFESERDIK